MFNEKVGELYKMSKRKWNFLTSADKVKLLLDYESGTSTRYRK